MRVQTGGESRQVNQKESTGHQLPSAHPMQELHLLTCDWKSDSRHSHYSQKPVSDPSARTCHSLALNRRAISHRACGNHADQQACTLLGPGTCCLPTIERDKMGDVNSGVPCQLLDSKDVEGGKWSRAGHNVLIARPNASPPLPTLLDLQPRQTAARTTRPHNNV